MLSPHNPHDSSATITYEAPTKPKRYVLSYLSKEQYTNFEKEETKRVAKSTHMYFLLILYDRRLFHVSTMQFTKNGTHLDN